MLKLKQVFHLIILQIKQFEFAFHFSLFGLITFYFLTDWYVEPIEISLRFFNKYQFGFSFNHYNGWALFIYHGIDIKCIQITKQEYDAQAWLDSLKAID